MIQRALPEKYKQRRKWAFGDSPELADELLALVLTGIKTASCSAWHAYDKDRDYPQTGDINVVLDGAGHSRCVLQTVQLQRINFDCVTAEMAFAEGEGDRSLAHWRREHQRFFECAGLFSPTMPLIFEYFRVIDRLDGEK